MRCLETITKRSAGSAGGASVLTGSGFGSGSFSDSGGGGEREPASLTSGSFLYSIAKITLGSWKLK